MKKKGQSAVEFMLLVGVVFFFFVVFLVAIQVNIKIKVRESVDLELKEVALIVQDEISLAVESTDGYSRNFDLPLKVRGLDYNVNINGGLVYVRTVDGNNALALSVLNVTGDVVVGGNAIRREDGIVYLNS